VALSNTAQRFETLKPSIASVDSALAENIGQRLDLINTSMENDPETAMADLGKTVTLVCDRSAVLHLRQVSPQNIVHGEGLDRALHHAGHGVIHEIGGNAKRFGEQFIHAAQ
jgi:hypothetical protein